MLTGMPVEEFNKEVTKWIAATKHPRWDRPYTELTYEPMLEAMRYLRENGYKTYIVTGGGQDFVRVYAGRVYGIPPEQGAPNLSPAVIARLKREREIEYQRWQKRNLSARHYAYVWADGVYLCWC